MSLLKLWVVRLSTACLLCLGLLSATTAQDREAQLAEAEKLNQRAAELYGAGRYAEAIPLAERTLAMREKVLGAEHPDVALSLNNLARLYQATGDYARAAPLFQRSLAIWEKVLGPEHPDVALSLSNLALLYHDQGAYARAEPRYQRSLAIREKVLGPDIPLWQTRSTIWRGCITPQAITPAPCHSTNALW